VILPEESAIKFKQEYLLFETFTVFFITFDEEKLLLNFVFFGNNNIKILIS
jgi:hypothetical protein